MGQFIDLTGQRHGRLTVLRLAEKISQGKSTWLCVCDCGVDKIIQGYNLKSGHTKSCGCLIFKHGHTTGNRRSPTYASWTNMIQRCINPNNKRYQNYGGRGITVCERWMKFENFLEDMGEIPEERQIDRINNDLGYCKENCRWSTRIAQARNTTRSHFITYGGKTQCVSAWAEELNIGYSTLYSRIRRGWSTEKTFTASVVN